MSALFTKDTKAIFWNNNAKAIQRMLDYGYICRRETPSVAAIVHPTSQSSFQKFFFGPDEVLIPIYRSTKEAVESHADCDTFLNFASFRTAYDVTMDALQFDSIKTLMVTAEGIPERLTRQMNVEAKRRNKIIIGPATVGAITPGAFKIANVGGTISNIVQCKLQRPGSAGLVTKSGGLFNELCNIIARNADGLAEGVAIGGDSFPGTSFLDHFIRMESNPQVHYLILLGEVGGTAEYDVIKAVQDGTITKPIIGWSIGTVAKHFASGVQFGHAGAKADVAAEQSDAKNKAMKDAGFIVPDGFNDLPRVINEVYTKAAQKAKIEDFPVPEIPEDFSSAKKVGKIRKETNFVCTISDDRGDEAVYAGIPISQLATPDTGYGIGDVITLLWFKKRYPKWASDFIETVLKVVADHGPAVSGAHNTRVTARAEKDVLTSVVTGLLTIGPRFGGAIDGAAKYFKYGYDHQLSARDFLVYMKQQNVPIPGIGHRIKSIKNPDLRVEGLKRYAQQHFPQTNYLNYALEIEAATTAKKGNLILNVDGCVGVLMVDMWQALGHDNAEINDYIQSGVLNAFFALGRMIGFVGHALDEKRLKMPLYRHELDDILYDVEDATVIA